VERAIARWRSRIPNCCARLGDGLVRIRKRERLGLRSRALPKTEPHRMNPPLGTADNHWHIPNCRIDGVLRRSAIGLHSGVQGTGQTIQLPREAAQDGASGHHLVFVQERKMDMPRIRIS
jgi:hypothetical protein